MLLTISYCIAIGIVLLSIGQGAFAASYTWQLFRSKRKKAIEMLPRTAVILSLRGADPFLFANMLRVLDQDYPDFTLIIIVDSAQDSAWPDVHRMEAIAPGRVVSMTVKDRLSTCSLKCCALAEAVEQLDESYEIVAFLDGDTSPHRRWLRDLVEPLSTTKIGVSTGNRWYTPDTISWGALVRYFWNAGAIVQVWINEITWAGSMAMRLKVIRDIGLVEAWRQSLSVDGTVSRQMKAHGLKTAFVPTVILPNREDIKISNFIPWSERQLVAAKSSGSGWSIVLFHAIAIASCIIAPMAMLAVGTYFRDSTILALSFTSIIVYWSIASISTLAIEAGIQRVLASNEVQSRWMNRVAIVRFLPAMVLSHFVYFRALAGACFRNQVSWRGVDYQVHGVNNIKRLNYQPYQSESTKQSDSSII